MKRYSSWNDELGPANFERPVIACEIASTLNNISWRRNIRKRTPGTARIVVNHYLFDK